MTAAQIDRAVARATQESLREVRHLGFGLADAMDLERDRELDDRLPLMIDWDEREALSANH
jgi:hypothetical protein